MVFKGTLILCLLLLGYCTESKGRSTGESGRYFDNEVSEDIEEQTVEELDDDEKWSDHPSDGERGGGGRSTEFEAEYPSGEMESSSRDLNDLGDEPSDEELLAEDGLIEETDSADEDGFDEVDRSVEAERFQSEDSEGSSDASLEHGNGQIGGLPQKTADHDMDAESEEDGLEHGNGQIGGLPPKTADHDVDAASEEDRLEHSNGQISDFPPETADDDVGAESDEDLLEHRNGQIDGLPPTTAEQGVGAGVDDTQTMDEGSSTEQPDVADSGAVSALHTSMRMAGFMFKKTLTDAKRIYDAAFGILSTMEDSMRIPGLPRQMTELKHRKRPWHSPRDRRRHHYGQRELAEDGHHQA